VGWFCLDWTRRRILARRKLPFVVVGSRAGCYPFDVNAEQIPNPESRVLLGDRTDGHGRRLLKVDWRMAEQDTESLMQTLRLLQRDFASSGVAQLEFDDNTLHDLVAASTPVGGHHIGTARMAESSRHGVVDPNGAVHGFPNLYCAGSAVFPTCGHANPTLTLVALAVRLADHLKAAFKNDRTHLGLRPMAQIV
jgi:choline dehydrogenase-like flavoprotein